MDYNWIAIGNRIKDERMELSLTQDGLADMVQLISRQLVSKWERAISPPTLDNLLDLCKVFKCELGYLLCEYNNKTRVSTDIQSVTGLSEEAIKILSHMKNLYIRESILSLNKILEHKDFYDLLSAIHLHAINFNHNKFKVDQENVELIANALNCKQDEVKKYLESSSKSAIESIIMNIIQDIDLGLTKKRTVKPLSKA